MKLVEEILYNVKIKKEINNVNSEATNTVTYKMFPLLLLPLTSITPILSTINFISIHSVYLPSSPFIPATPSALPYL